MNRPALLASVLLFAMASTGCLSAAERWDAPGNANPVLPGYYADPDVLEVDGHYYLYATMDPWGGERLACWESSNFKDWTYRELNWPTKAACTSPTSKSAMVWAPSVVRGADGKFHMHVSVGSEVWTGVAEHPLGPWSNPLGDKPLIPENYRPGYHMIDAQAFVDTDGAAYLYWGSGWNWTNGKCFAVRLTPDMAHFDGEPVDVTPSHYFEGPIVFRKGDLYYLMYSDGITIKDTYEIHYAIGKSPLGPFEEASNSPILKTDRSKNVVSPGHHTVMKTDDGYFIVYHRNSIPFVEGEAYRRICVDAFTIDDDGLIQVKGPTHAGPALVAGRDAGRMEAGVAKLSASSSQVGYEASKVDDRTYATLWKSASDDARPWLQVDLGKPTEVSRLELRLEYAWKGYGLTVLSSDDGENWKPLATTSAEQPVGSPLVVPVEGTARYFRVSFDELPDGEVAGLWELSVFPAE